MTDRLDRLERHLDDVLAGPRRLIRSLSKHTTGIDTMTTEWALVPAESTVYMDAAGRRALSNNGCDNVEDQDAEKCYRAMLAESPGAALLAEVLAALNDARDLTAAALSEEKAKFKGYEHCSDIPSIEADLARLDGILDKLGPAAEGAT